MTKINYGKRLYDAELAKQPNYAATGKPRPKWDELNEHAQSAWQKKADAGK